MTVFFGSVDFKGLLIVTKEMDPERIQIRDFATFG